MTSFNKKRIRISSPGSISDEEDEGNPKTHENGINGDACRETSSKSNTCIVCDGNDNWVLLCHGEECPIAIHQRCLSDEPDFDEFGNFFCPYCCYKRVFAKSLKLRKKIDKSRETLQGVDLGLKMDEDMENVLDVNVTGGRRIVPTRESDESYERFMEMEKDQRMKEVAADTQSREVSEAGDDDDVDREASYACNSNASERRKGRARGSERGSERKYEEVQVRNKQRRCDIYHETVEVNGLFVGVKTRTQRRFGEKSQKNKVVAGTHEQDVFMNDEGTQAHDSDLGCCHENNQQQKASSTESCDQEVTRTDKRGLHGSGSGEGRYSEKKKHYTKTVEIETRDRKVSKEWERKREGAVERDDYARLSEQANGFRKGEQIERNCVSSISSPMSTDNVDDTRAASQELALVIHRKSGVQEGPIEAKPFRSVPPQPESHMEKNGAASNDPGQRRNVSCSDRKRKRIFWTQAEEEMLRVGVQKFPGFRNIPWRKILEFGKDVFQEERVPSDLKDKWKNMHKMSSETGKMVSLSIERKPNHSVS